MPNFLTWESRDSEQMLKVKYTPTVTANFLDTNEATNITLGKLQMVKMRDWLMVKSNIWPNMWNAIAVSGDYEITLLKL